MSRTKEYYFEGDRFSDNNLPTLPSEYIGTGIHIEEDEKDLYLAGIPTSKPFKIIESHNGQIEYHKGSSGVLVVVFRSKTSSDVELLAVYPKVGCMLLEVNEEYRAKQKNKKVRPLDLKQIETLEEIVYMECPQDVAKRVMCRVLENFNGEITEMHEEIKFQDFSE